ncbi:hypothetical protein PIB30_050040 [Stylosanthes scabra]|uniref:DUF1985 domain-containing protein n=1 Tax=Stylosanthes scabra TaxID=79078 RepID=A0ABU6ZGD7_9FABA|nr:hypothetical protein [Stylosanthes scabra]
MYNDSLRNNADKMALIEKLGFRAFSHLPDYNLKQHMLKELVNIYNIHDNTIHSVRGDVQITTDKIGKALGLSWNGDPFDERVSEKDLNDEDHAIFKMFEGKSQAELTMLVKTTPVDTEANQNLFKRAFLIFIQNVFLLTTSSPNVTPKALPTLFGLENTWERNWALHVHDFLLDEVKKAKWNKTKAGLVQTGLLKAAKEKLQKKNMDLEMGLNLRRKEPSSSESESEFDSEEEYESEVDGARSEDHPLVESIKRPAPIMHQETAALGKRKQPDRAAKAKRPNQGDGLGAANVGVGKPLQPRPQPHPQPEPDRAAKKARKPTLDDPVERASDQNIYPTQEVIDLSSSPEEDRQQPIVPKEEQDVETSPSPRSQMISSVLVSIRREHQQMEPPSFDLGVEPPLLTPQTMDAIDDIDDQLQKNPSLLRTPDPLGTFNILADMEIRADLDKFREKIVANILLSPENLMRMDVVTEVNEIHLIKPGAALRSPFTQFDSADLKTN